MLFKLCKEDSSLHVLGGSGAEIVNGTIIDAVLCEGGFDRRSALLVFVHNKKVSFRQTLDESRKVGITRHNDKRCDAVTIEARDNTRCHSDIDQGLSIGHTVDLDMLLQELRKRTKDNILTFIFMHYRKKHHKRNLKTACREVKL